jgi:hypothetical protein
MTHEEQRLWNQRERERTKREKREEEKTLKHFGTELEPAKECGIYRIVGPTERSYVGQSKDIRHRWEQHRKDVLKPETYYDSRFRQHVAQYGWDRFKWQILEPCQPCHLNIRELYWMIRFNAHIDGYNNMSEYIRLRIYTNTYELENGVLKIGVGQSSELRCIHCDYVKEQNEFIPDLPHLTPILICRSCEAHHKEPQAVNSFDDPFFVLPPSSRSFVNLVDEL